MKITVYTTSDCQFSKQEKEYLASHSLEYEEKNLETNKNFLTEMLAISNNFAGTPVTRVEKDDGSIAVLKGFTKEEFDTTLGLTPAASPTPPPTPVITTEEPPKVEEIPPAEVVPPVEAAPPVVETPVPPVEETPAAPAIDPELNSVLDKLKEETAAPVAPTETVQPVTPPIDNPTPTTAMPNIPDPDFK
jgi:glutaredoxin